MIHSVKATNSLGYEFSFTEDARIVNGFDVSGLSADVNYTETTAAGSRYQNTRLSNRELAFEVQLRRNRNSEDVMDAIRENMYRVFTPELNPIRFDFKLTNGGEYYLTAYALNAPVMRPDKSNDHAAFQRMLLQFTCTDPYIYQNVEARFELATYEGGLEFDWEIPEDGDVFETRVESLSGNVYYPGTGIDGMLIKFMASGITSNPTLTNAYTGENLKLNINLLPGDVVEVSTYRGNRSITLIRQGNRTNIFYTLALPYSTFLQLRPGDNDFIYGADEGLELLDIAIEYRIRKVGV